jgi:hypothetical protein
VLTALALFPLQQWSRDTAEAVFAFLLAGYLPLSIVLAGVVSVGEDTALGLRAWHLTLPVSARVQWLVKLVVSLSVGAGLAIALPLVLVSLTSAVLPLELGLFRTLAQPTTVILIASGLVLSFWASTFFGHTVRSALATGLAAVALSLCVSLADRLGDYFVPGTMVNSLAERFRVPPDYLLLAEGTAVWTLLFTIIPLLALGQSFAAFRRVESDVRTIGRHAATLLAVAFVITLCFAVLESAYHLRVVVP